MSRLRQRLGNPTIHVEQIPGGERVRLDNGAVIDKNRWGTGPLIDGLATAIELARPGEVIGIRGRLRGASVGGGDPNKAGTAGWSGGRAVKVAIVNEDDTAPGEILGLTIASSLGGIDVLTICGPTILCPSGGSSAVVVQQGSNTGRLNLWDFTLDAEDRTAWNNHGSKWPLRAHGHLNGINGPVQAFYNGQEFNGDGSGGGIEMRNGVILPGQEHAYLYGDNLGPNSAIDGIRCHPAYDRSKWVERTLVQVTNRANPAGVTAGGPSGYGRLEIANVEAIRCGGDPSSGSAGGSAITVAGHLGPVYLHDLQLREYHGGGIVVWTDAAAIKGVWKFRDGFTTGAVTVENVDCQCSVNSAPHIAVSGARKLHVGGDFLVKGPNVGIDIDNDYGGPIDTGPLELALGAVPAMHPGWQQIGPKIRRANHVLTATEIQACAVVEGTQVP